MRIVVMASGRGSNLRALLDGSEAGITGSDVVAVVSDQPAAPALSFAKQRNIETTVVERRKDEKRVAWDERLTQTLSSYNPELIVMAGFMRLVGPRVLETFANRIINIHPSLLPSFPGKDAPRQALAAGVKISGCTVHLVDAGIDTGPILAQAAVPVAPNDTEQSLHVRIQNSEHMLLPRVVGWIARGQLLLSPKPRYPEPVFIDHMSVVFGPPIERSHIG